MRRGVHDEELNTRVLWPSLFCSVFERECCQQDLYQYLLYSKQSYIHVSTVRSTKFLLPVGEGSFGVLPAKIYKLSDD